MIVDYHDPQVFETKAPETDLPGPAAPLVMPNGLGMILSLNRLGKHVYAGTVYGAEKARRRARGKRDRAARRAGRN